MNHRSGMMASPHQYIQRSKASFLFAVHPRFSISSCNCSFSIFIIPLTHNDVRRNQGDNTPISCPQIWTKRTSSLFSKFIKKNCMEIMHPAISFKRAKIRARLYLRLPSQIYFRRIALSGIQTFAALRIALLASGLPNRDPLRRIPCSLQYDRFSQLR
ncbi:MAG: hypothetical protein H6Q65_83 [Firmicutes bacterium]|nr:hypothetical protein [Bacillota bacterium]